MMVGLGQFTGPTAHGADDTIPQAYAKAAADQVASTPARP